MEFHVLAQQAVGAHDHVQLAFFQLFQGLLLLGGGAEPAEHLHPHVEAGKALLDGVVVLLHQNGGRGQQGHLLALHHGLEGGPQGYLRLAVPHVAAQKPVHVVRAFHVGLDLGHGLLLILRQLVGEGVLELLLPRVFVAEGIAGVFGPAGVQRRQIEGQLFQPRLHLALLTLPFAAAQMVQLGQAVLRADELLHPVELVGGHVELVVSGVLNLQIVPGHAVALHLGHAQINAYAVQVVHHVIAGLQVGKAGNPLPGVLLLPGPVIGGAENVRIAEHAQVRVRMQEALVVGDRQQHHLPQDDVAVQRFAVHGGDVHLLQRFLQPAAPVLAAGQQDDGAVLLLPRPDVLAQCGQLVLIGHGRLGAEGDQLIRQEPSQRGLHVVAQRYHGPLFPVGQQLVIREAQVFLLVEGVAPQPRVLVGLGKFLLQHLHAPGVLLGPVAQKDGVVQIIQRGNRLLAQHVHPHGRGAQGLSRFHQRGFVQMATLVGHVLPEGLRRFFLRAGFLRGFGRLAQLGRFAVQQVFAELQRVQLGKELVQRRQRIAVIQRGLLGVKLLRLCPLPRAGLDGPAKPLRRRFPVGHKAFRGRGDTGRGQPLNAPLTDAVEPADAVHLRIEKLNAQGVALVGREHVQNGAPHGALAAALHHGDPLVAAGQQAAHQLLRGIIPAFLQRDYALAENRLRHAAVQQAFQTKAQNARVFPAKLVQIAQPQPRAFPAGRGAAELQISRRQHAAFFPGQPLNVLRIALGHQLRGAQQHHRAARLAPQRRRQKGPLALGNFINGRTARPAQPFHQRFPLVPAFVGAEKPLVHSFPSSACSEAAASSPSGAAFFVDFSFFGFLVL